MTIPMRASRVHVLMYHTVMHECLNETDVLTAFCFFVVVEPCRQMNISGASGAQGR